MIHRFGRSRRLWLALGAIAERMRAANGLALAADYDGTLTPIVAHPDQARLAPRTRSALEAIARLPGARLAVLSGRALDDLARHLALDGIFLSGQAGLQTRDPSGRVETHLRADQRLPAALHDPLSAWTARFPGAWIEDKGLVIALHYRAVPAGRRLLFVTGIRRRIAPFRNRVTLVRGKCVLELMPPGGRNKASALEQWLGPHPSGALEVYLGDDTHDEPALAWMRGRDGVSVAIGRITTRAEFALASPLEVTWFLEWLAREWAARSAAAPPAPTERSGA